MHSEDHPKNPAASLQRPAPSFRVVGLEPPPFVEVMETSPAEMQERQPEVPLIRSQVTGKIRPGGGLLPSKISPLRPAVPREKITGALALVPNPTDETVFEEATKPETKYYMPRYRVAEQAVSGKAQFRIKLDQKDQGGTLTIFLERFPAPKLEPIVRQAIEIPHSIAVKLVARIPMGTSHIQQELVFQEITKEGQLLKAVLRLEQLAQLTQVYQVLTEASFAASLVVLRSAKVAVPVPASNGAEAQQLTAQIQKLQQEIGNLNKQITALDARKKQLERLGPANPTARRMLQALQVQLNNLNALRTAKTTELRQKRVQLGSLQKQKLFRIAPQVMSWTVAPSPFAFAKDLHRYIFGSVIPPEGGKIGFVLRQVVWKERSHTYYQQSLEPHRFHFLPDSFKVARRPETPHYPMLAVRFPNPDAAEDVMPVTLEYVAEPYFDVERLEAAAADLKRKLPELAASDRQIEFEPLLCDNTHLFVTLPRGEAGPQREERKGATISLRTGILDAITLPMRDFQGLFDALFGDSAVVFQGEVVIEIDSGQGIPAEKVPVICRLADLIGDIFDIELEQDASSNGVRATLRNAIESPAEMRGLTAELTRNVSHADGVISGLSFEAPIVVPPGETVKCQVTPATGLGGSGDVSVEFNFERVTIKPDAEAVWEAVVDQTRLPEFTRTIKVKTIKQTFEPRPDQPSDPVLAVVVDFERGDTIDLSADKLEADAKVRLSLADYVIRRLDTGQYRYLVTVVRASGQSKDSEWRTDRTGILFPPIIERPPESG
ncbi:MAG TPA: hypothetical protein VIS96_10360 [Terrimicrobiaceae bacterium]